MPINKIRIATRKSPLALWQAGYVRDSLLQLYPELKVELIAMHTQGDRILDRPLYNEGGKGLFLKELEQALYDGSADIAVHSMKDVTIDMSEGLSIVAMMRREDPHDVLISNRYQCIDQLPQGASVGTSSLRRQCQLLSWRKDLQVNHLRGNIGTRLQKLDAGIYDAIILAAAGIKRLGLAERICQFIPTDILLPAIGQGAIGIQARIDNDSIFAQIRALANEATEQRVNAERAISRKLGGGCHLPIAAYAEVYDETIMIHGLVGRADGSEIITENIIGHKQHGESLGNKLAENLLQRGAGEILQELTDA